MMSPLRTFSADRALVNVYQSTQDAGQAAALEGANTLRRVIAERGSARVIVATGNSQQDMVATLVKLPDINWARVDVFHMDEYVGLSATHPASFRLWVKTRLVDVVHPRRVEYLNGDLPDLAGECCRFGKAIQSELPDLCFLGIGENGHIAFNDPHVADFNDPAVVKRVELDETCRRQQVGEGHFPNLDAVPYEAITLTCPALMSARHLVCCVPERRKAEAVRNALQGPISTSCPGSIVRTHGRAVIFLDLESCSLLS
jgi:glucosamine-6-phosphate deaminase